MDNQPLKTAIAFLTVGEGDLAHELVDLELMATMYETNPNNVLSYLRKMITDYNRHLRRHLKRDKTHPRINEIVARRFRVKMALNTLRNAMAREAA